MGGGYTGMLQVGVEEEEEGRVAAQGRLVLSLVRFSPLPRDGWLSESGSSAAMEGAPYGCECGSSLL